MIFLLPRRVVLAASLCLIALLTGCSHAPSAAQDPEAAANGFFALIEKGDARAAYDSAAFGFQVAQTFDAFLSNARELGLVGGQPPAWTRKALDGAETRLDGTVITQFGTPINISVTLTPDGKDWKLFSLRTSIGRQEAENRFTVVGKGSDFNDVYHQPMPDSKQLADLVHDTLTTFNTAAQRADFHDFFNSVSEYWKNGLQPYRGAAADAGNVNKDQFQSVQADSRLTEKMLKDHFQGFVDKKIELSSVAGLPPVFDRPPLITQNGFLDLYGHFDAPQYRVYFFLEYVYELPHWKLFGIEIELRQ